MTEDELQQQMQMAQEVIPKTYMEAYGIREDISGFTTQVAEHGFMVDVSLMDASEMAKKLAEKYIEQANDVTFVIEEGDVRMTWTNCSITALYGFKSISFVTQDKPVIA